MNTNDVRAALLMDHLHGRLLVYTSDGAKPQFDFLPAGLPPNLRDIDDPSVTYRMRADYEENRRDFFREAAARLAGASHIVLTGPGTAKQELGNEIAAMPAFRESSIRTLGAEWMDEPAFELWARRELMIPGEVPFIYVRSPRPGARRRISSPGTPIDPESYQRTNEIRPSARGEAQAGD